MKKIAFFGGSFNPITNAHIGLANEIIEKYDIEKVIFIPVGKHYPKKGLMEEKHRYRMIQLGIQGCLHLGVSNIELNQEKNLNMLEALEKIKQSYQDCEPYFIIGGDNLKRMLRFKRTE